MTKDEQKGSTAAVPAQVGGLERKYINSADAQERANIMSATYTCDNQLVSTNAKDFISTVRCVPSAGQHGKLNTNRIPICETLYFAARALGTGRWARAAVLNMDTIGSHFLQRAGYSYLSVHDFYDLLLFSSTKPRVLGGV